MRSWLRKRWVALTVSLATLAPLACIAWRYAQGRFVVDPVRQITTITGKTALIMLLLTLAVTPARRILGLRTLAPARRVLGLAAFGYAALHLLIYAGWDYGFNLALLGPALVSQRFIVAGLAAFVLMLPLAITSTAGWMRRLGRRWSRLHWLVYPAAGLVIGHFLWLRKDPREPLRYGGALALLFVLRIPAVERTLIRARQRLAPGRGDEGRDGGR